MPDKSRDAVVRVFKKIIAGEVEPLSKYENELLTKNGEVRYIDWNNAIEENSKGVIVGTLSSGQDITQRKQAEEAAQRYHRDMAHVMRLSTMGEMATGMAHELNQPLTAIVSYCGTALSLLNALPSSSQQLGEIMVRTAKQAHRASDIIRHLREHVRKEDQGDEFFELDHAIQDIITFIKREVQQRGAEIESRLGGQERKVKGRKIQIEQVLINWVYADSCGLILAFLGNGGRNAATIFSLR